MSVRTICSSHTPSHTCYQYSIFPPNLVVSVRLFVGDFSIAAGEAYGGFEIFIVKNFGDLFCTKHLCLYSAPAALDFIYHIQETCHMHAVAFYGFALRGVTLR